MNYRMLKVYLQANWLKTFYLNFKLLPFRQALRLPILLYGAFDICVGRSAKINIKAGGGRFASVMIGNSYSRMCGKNIRPHLSHLAILGTLNLLGKTIFIGNGCNITIEKGASLSIGNNVYINNLTKIYCYNEIAIGALTRLSWECQLYDTNFHYISDENGRIERADGKIKIGDGCLVGNRVSLQKGAVIPNYSIVASNSLVNKDFKNCPNSVIAGCPAKVVRSGCVFVNNYVIEHQLDEFFMTNHDAAEVCVTDVELCKMHQSHRATLIIND